MFYMSITIPDFFREGCTAMGRNACDLLRLAGQEVSIPAILRIISSVPYNWRHIQSDGWRGMAFDEASKLALDRSKGTADEQRCLEVLDYFFKHVPELDRAARQMLEEAFVGVLRGIDPDYAMQVPTRRECPEQFPQLDLS
jgi:hypothetical protein